MDPVKNGAEVITRSNDRKNTGRGGVTWQGRADDGKIR